MNEVTDFLLTTKGFLAGQVFLFLRSYFYFWLFFTFLEAILPDEKRSPFSKHQVNEIIFGLFIAICLWPFDTTINIEQIRNFSLSSIFDSSYTEFLGQLPLIIQIVLAAFFLDVGQYFRHRLLHSKLFWPFHATHHSAIELRSSTHFRTHPLDFFVSKAFTFAVLFLIGVSIEALSAAIVFTTVNNMWLHSNIDFDYGYPLRYVLSSPNYHKWHHSVDKEAQNKNYADIFPVLDILGGTYYYPKDKNPTSYGVINEPKLSELHQTFWGPLVYPFIKKRSNKNAENV